MESHTHSDFLKKLRKGLYSTIDMLAKPFEALLLFILKSLRIDMEPIVIGSGFSSSFARYVAKSSRILLTAFLLSFATTFIFALHLLSSPLLTAIVSLAIPLLIVLPVALAFTIFLPTVLYRNRGEVVESKALQLLLALSLLGASGLSIYKVLESLPMVLGKDSRFFSVEIDLAASLVRVGVPVDEALKRVANITPSQTLRELFSSLASSVSIGGGISNVLSNILDRYVSRYSIRIERAVETLNVYMEVYVAIALLIPVLIGSVAALLLISPMGWLSFDALIILATLLLVPIASASIVVLSDVIVSRMRP